MQNASQMQSVIVRRSAQKRENKVNLMVFVMLFAFLVCWTPYAAISAYQVLNKVVLLNGEDFKDNIFLQIFGGFVSASASFFPVLFCKSSICWNPVIYVLMNSQVGTDLLNKPCFV